MSDYLNKKIADYVKKSSLQDIKEVKWDELDTYQKELASTNIEYVDSNLTQVSDLTSIAVSPLNNMAFANLVVNGETDLTKSAYYLLTSLSTKDNTFLFDKDKLIKLFKSNIGITDLPYSLVLYLGALHYANQKWKWSDSVPDSYYSIPNILDGNKSNDFDITVDGAYAPNYGTRGGVTVNYYNIAGQNVIGETEVKKDIIPSIRIYNDSSYRKKYTSSFIPKFGYGTYSSFMNEYYEFISDKNGSIKSSYDNGDKPFHIFGAERGFVKSFKTYKPSDNGDIDVNFMGHYTILTNKYSFKIPEQIDLVKEYSNIVNSLTEDNIKKLPVYNIDEKTLRSVYKLFCKLKIAHVTDTKGYNTKDSLKNVITNLNNVKINEMPNNVGVGLFSYIVLYYFYNMDPKKRGVTDKLFNYNNDLMTTYLLNMWKSEKDYLTANLQNFDTDATLNTNLNILLYPSAGGVFGAEKLFLSVGDTKIKNIKLSNNITKNLDDSEINGTNTSPHKNQQYIKNVKEYLDISLDNLEEFNYTDSSKPTYLVTKSSAKLTGLHFNNKSLIENITRFVWYDTAYDGINLFCKDVIKPNYYDNAVNKERLNNTNIQDCLFPQSADANNSYFFRNVYKNQDGKFDGKSKNPLTLQELYEIVDFEKLDAFKQVFIDFSTKYINRDANKQYNNNENYTMENILKGISTIDETNFNFSDDVIKEMGFDEIKTVEDILLLVAGYSSYNYYFCSEYNISAIINAALTLAQYNRVEGTDGVLKTFMQQKMTVNNYSTIGSVAYKDLHTQYHRYVFRPDVILNGGDLSTNGADEKKILAYYVRKFIFGDTDVAPYNNPSNDLYQQYINDYINTKNYTTQQVLSLVNFIFKYLNVQFDYGTFAILHPYIVGILNATLNYSTPITINDVSVEIFVVDFFADMMNSVQKNTVNAMNGYLINLKDTLQNKYLNPQDKNSFFATKAKNEEDKRLDVKTKTYYNIKNIYDKYLSYQRNDITPLSNKYQNIDLSESLGEFSNTQGMLFYNFLYKDLSLDNTNSHVLGEVSKFNSNTPKHLCEYMQIVDRANNDVGDKILIDIVKLSENVHLDFNGGDNTDFLNRTVYSVFDFIAGDNGFILHPINGFVDRLSTLKTDQGLTTYADTLFGQHTTTDRVESNPAFILQWMDQSSSLDNKKNNLSQKTLTNSFTLDISYDGKNVLNESDIPEDLLRGQVTSFIVDFTNKNQNMFKNIQLNTSEFANTEESINAIVELAAKNGEQTNKISSGNLFRMMEQRSYTCQVESMGNALIQPLTYFYLKNVPLFRGAYWITNVEHKLSPNNMITTFKGVRQPLVSKTSNEREILSQIQKTLEKIAKSESAVTTNNFTKGDITQDRETGTYGTFYQKTSDGYDMPEFGGQDILASLTMAQFGDVTDVYKLFIALVYNRARTKSKNTVPSDIVKYMVDIALQLKSNYNSTELKTFMDESNVFKGSLSELTSKYHVSPTNRIYVLLDSISKSKSSEEVYKLLIPDKTRLTSQLLKITSSTGNVRSKLGKDIFNEDTKEVPKRTYNDIDTSANFDNAFTAYSIIYMKNIDTTTDTSTEKKNTIYNTNVNNENVKQFVLLNTYSVENLTTNYSDANDPYKTTYLGCFDKTLGITFFGGEGVGNDITLLNKVNKNTLVNNKLEKITDKEARKNAIKIKNLLKSKGLTKQQVAGIMGNIEHESRYNPNLINRYEKNGSKDYGLVQFNTKYYGDKEKDVDKALMNVQKNVGSTVESQINFLLQQDDVKTFVEKTAHMTDTFDVAMLFAKHFERCTNCYDSADIKKWVITENDRKKMNSDNTNKPYQRGQRAKRVFDRLNTKDDELYWDSDSTTLMTASPILSIGDSISIALNKQNQTIDIITSPVELSKSGSGIKTLITNLTDKQVGVMSGYKSVILSIGVNDQWIFSDDVNKLISLMKEKFVGAKFYILNGHYGWGNVSTDKIPVSELENRISKYIGTFQKNGFTVLGKVTKVTKHPEPNDEFFNTFKNDLKNL